MSTVSPVTVEPKVEGEPLLGSNTPSAGPKLGTVVLERLRVEQLLEQREGWRLYLADDLADVGLVLVVFAESEEALAKALSDLSSQVDSDTVLQHTRWHSFLVAEVALDRAHLVRFGEQILAAPPAATQQPTLQSPSAGPEARLAEGSIFAGRYRVDGVLGRGGMGEVYRAHDVTFQRAVALKVVRLGAADEAAAQREEAKRRLLKEARLVSVLKHPHIVEIHDAGEFDGLPYLVLELCPGGNLRQAMTMNPPQGDRLRWLTEIAEALAHAHETGVIHRDIKPENVIFTRDGNAKVTDFGIAKALRTEETQEIETIGAIGTPRYMAPEQLFGNPVDARADQFAWAMMAYEVITGVHPRANHVRWAQGNRDVTLIANIPLPLRRVLVRAMLNDPEKRYPDFHALLDELRVVHRRRKPRVATAAAVLLVLAAILILTHRRTNSDQAYAGAGATASEARRGPLDPPPHGASAFAAAPEGVPSEARAAYDAAYQLWIDASPQDALSALESATSLDSSFARAHLLYALVDDITPAAREHYQLAAQHRAKLSARERSLLDALDPSLRDPLDLEETRKRLEHLEEQFPEDPDIPIFIASRYLLAWEGKRALPHAEKAVHVAEPSRPIARLMYARSLAKLNQLEESRNEYAQCFASSPSATGCLRWNAKLDAGDGRCSNVEQLARRLIAAAPRNPDGYFFLAGGLAGQSAALPATRAALETRWTVLPSSAATWTRLEETFYLQVSGGAFDDAEQTLDAWEAEAQHFTDADHRGVPAIQRMLLNLELGRNAKVATLARAYLDQSRAWTEGASILFDIEAKRLLYHAGAIRREEFRRIRDEWLVTAAHRRIGRNNLELLLWYEGFVEPVVDADDALLALSKRPAGLEEPDRELLQGQAFQKLGRMYLLAGQLPEAIKFSKRSVEACYYKYPFHQTWASLDYAKALGQNNEAVLALRQLDTISHRWGNESHSRTNRDARTLSAQLHSALATRK